jgi:hypothetical protein
VSMNVNLAKAFEPSPGSPFAHGEIGWFDELALVGCVLVFFAVLVVFYVRELGKTRKHD